MDSLAMERAVLSKGTSNDRIYDAMYAELATLPLPKEATLIDVGAGRGYIWAKMRRLFTRYIGVDLVRHQDFPSEFPMIEHDLNTPGIPLEAGSGDVVISCETTPCLENPRVLFRELARLVKPGGWVVVTNPNNLNLLSLATLALRQRFNLFQDLSYPFMITPILECDLLRMSKEVGLVDARIYYTMAGKVPKMGRYYPEWIPRRISPRLFSDHLGVIARKPL